MADLIKVSCGECGTKYRLPVEFQGRSAKCKKCGAQFKVPVEKSLEDSVLDWLSEEEEDQDEPVERPRIVNAAKETAKPVSQESGTIRRKKAEGE